MNDLNDAAGWARNARPGLLGDPHYYRYFRGKGIVHVAPDPEADSFYWWLQPGTGRLDGPVATGFADPATAMQAADESVVIMRPATFEGLSRAEAQELYRKLARARPLRSPGEHPDSPSDLDSLRYDVYLHLDVLDMAPVALPHTPADEFTYEALSRGRGVWQRKLSEAERRRAPGSGKPSRPPLDFPHEARPRATGRTPVTRRPGRQVLPHTQGRSQ
jgi:hypothetical protein